MEFMVENNQSISRDKEDLKKGERVRIPKEIPSWIKKWMVEYGFSPLNLVKM